MVNSIVDLLTSSASPSAGISSGTMRPFYYDLAAARIPPSLFRTHCGKILPVVLGEFVRELKKQLWIV